MRPCEARWLTSGFPTRRALHWAPLPSANMATDQLRAEFVSMTKVGRSLAGKDELLQASKLAEALKAHLRSKAQALLRNAEGGVVMLSYQCDATSYLVNSTSSVATAGKSVARSGKHLEEFLLQKGVLRARKPGSIGEVALLVGDPCPLTNGKKATHHFWAACKFHPLLRRERPDGLCIFHCAADRAIQAPLERMLRQRRASYYKAIKDQDEQKGKIGRAHV